jgi:predicted alpha/beta superfamily hydrolase
MNAQDRHFKLTGTHLIQMESELTGRNHELIVFLPDSYESSPEKEYPVLYFLDAYWDMPLLYAIHGQLVWDNVLPELIMVGFSYPGEDADYGELRARDLTPRKVGSDNSTTGDGPKFLQFIEDTVIPYIESRYRAKKDERAISGSSLGGLFTLYAMYEKPNLFKRFISISPAVDFDKRYLFKLDSAFVKNNKSLPVRLFLSQGGDEYVLFRQPIVEFQDKISKHNYKDFALLNYTIEGERHSGVKSEGYSRGLRWVFKDIAPAGPSGLEQAWH